MRVILLGCISIVLLAGCAARFSGLPADTPTHTLTLRWQRLVDASDNTCPRCSSTEQEVTKAFNHLRTSLAPVGIQVALQTERLDEATFLKAPLESNRIWINERPLEDWLAAQAASSACTGCCEGADCRTVSVDGATYEAIPAVLIVRAGFLAAGETLRGGSATPVSTAPAPIIGGHQ
jgi:hypothetical protein